MRGRGEVHWFRFDAPIGPHPVLAVSRPTGRRYVTTAFITSSPNQPEAPDIVLIEGMSCAGIIRGVVRCDQLNLLDKSDPAWDGYVVSLSDDDMAKVAAGLRAWLAI